MTVCLKYQKCTLSVAIWAISIVPGVGHKYYFGPIFIFSFVFCLHIKEWPVYLLNQYWLNEWDSSHRDVE